MSTCFFSDAIEVRDRITLKTIPDTEVAPTSEPNSEATAVKEGSRTDDAARLPLGSDEVTSCPAKEPADFMQNAQPPHVHAPHGGIRSWRDFFLHIAVVTIGLLLAVGLEQTVEAVHHALQRAQLEEQIRQTLERNSQISGENLQQLAGHRAYLAELHAAVAAHLHGHTAARPPRMDDPRRFQPLLFLPRLGPYDASQTNGNVALLGLSRIQIYTRLGAMRGVMQGDFERLLSAISALRGFAKRFDSMPNYTAVVPVADLDGLSASQLEEYQALIGATLESIDVLTSRLRAFDAESKAILGGARDESELIDAAKAALLAK